MQRFLRFRLKKKKREKCEAMWKILWMWNIAYVKVIKIVSFH